MKECPYCESNRINVYNVDKKSSSETDVFECAECCNILVNTNGLVRIPLEIHKEAESRRRKWYEK